MKTISKYKQKIFFTLLLFGLPFFVEAQSTFVLQNPIGSRAGSVLEFIALIVATVTRFVTPFVIVFIIYAGFLFVTAQGDVEKLKKAKRVLLFTVIGSAVLLGATLLSEIIFTTFSDLNVTP